MSPDFLTLEDVCALEERVQRRLTLEPKEAHRARLAELAAELVGPPSAAAGEG